jgi:HEAT repeat protein
MKRPAIITIALVIVAIFAVFVLDPYVARVRSERILQTLSELKESIEKNPTDRELNDELTQWMDRQNEWIRSKSLAVLAGLRGAFDSSDEGRDIFREIYLPVLRERLFDNSPYVRREAALAARGNPISAIPLIDDLERAIRDYSRTDTAWFSIEALSYMGSQAADSLPLMRAELEVSNWAKDSIHTSIYRLESDLQAHNKSVELTSEAPPHP